MKHLVILLIVLSLTACVSNKSLTSSVKSNEINELSYFEPLAYIQYIEKGNNLKFSDSLSNITRTKLDSILVSNKSKLRINDKINLSNDTIKFKFENEISYLSRLVNQNKTLEGIPLTPTIDSLLEINNQRFALGVVETGFGRRKGNYSGQVVKSIFVGILTLGLYIPTPIKASLSVEVFIFDSQNNEIAYYKKTAPVEKDPDNPEVIEKKVINLFEGYFYPKE
jgi:hypothetical protein